jgi:hypothetical protein
MVEGKLDVERVTMAGRPLAAHNVHERLMELLMKVSPPRVFTTVTADKIVELMCLGSGENAPLALSLAQVVESFYGVPGFPRLESASVLRKAIADGVSAGIFGYVGRSGEIDLGQLREQSGVHVTPNLVRIGSPLPETQVDVSLGAIVLPEAVEPESTPAQGDAGLTQPDTSTGTDATWPDVTPGTGPTLPRLETTVRLNMRVTRQQVYATANALANLAQQAGSIQVAVEAHSPEGFDPNWLQNAVLEPLDEADVELDG